MGNMKIPVDIPSVSFNRIYDWIYNKSYGSIMEEISDRSGDIWERVEEIVAQRIERNILNEGTNIGTFFLYF